MADKIEAHLKLVKAHALAAFEYSRGRVGPEVVDRWIKEIEASARALAQGEPGEAVATVRVEISNRGNRKVSTEWGDWLFSIPEGEHHLYLSPTASAPAAPIDKSELKRLVSLVFGDDFQIVRAPAAEPLTDEQIADLIPDDDTPMGLGEAFVKFARAIEKAHGIGTKEPAP